MLLQLPCTLVGTTLRHPTLAFVFVLEAFGALPLFADARFLLLPAQTTFGMLPRWLVAPAVLLVLWVVIPCLLRARIIAVPPIRLLALPLRATGLFADRRLALLLLALTLLPLGLLALAVLCLLSLPPDRGVPALLLLADGLVPRTVAVLLVLALHIACGLFALRGSFLPDAVAAFALALRLFTITTCALFILAVGDAGAWHLARFLVALGPAIFSLA